MTTLCRKRHSAATDSTILSPQWLWVKLLVVCCVLSCLCLSPVFSVTAASADTKEKKIEIERGIKKYRINIRRLQQGIQRKHDKVQHNLNEEKLLLAQLENIDRRLQQQVDKLNALKEKIAQQRPLIVAKEEELAKVKHKKRIVQLHLQKRISAYYKMRDIGVINVAFSAKTLPELLKFHDAFHSLMEYDHDVITTYRLAIDELQRAKQTLTLEQTVLEDFITQTHNEKERIKQTKREKENLLAHIRTQTKLHKQAISEMEKAASALSQSLVVMKNKGQLLDQGFRLNKGKMRSPVKGIITTLFNEKVKNSLGIEEKSMGIAIQAPDGTRVEAIYGGDILFSGYLRGYGNTVIVHHGYQYYSIISRVETLLKRKGDKVAEGDIIAIMGDTATLMNNGLYLEIRHGSKSLNPLDWLDKNMLPLASNKG